VLSYQKPGLGRGSLEKVDEPPLGAGGTVNVGLRALDRAAAREVERPANCHPTWIRRAALMINVRRPEATCNAACVPQPAGRWAIAPLELPSVMLLALNDE
jgi:hypothetical protein